MKKTDGTLLNKDYSISFARFIAMCFIVACHMMQRDDFTTDIWGAHIRWAFWFNIGVQMFLFISGFLYGSKDRIDTVVFFKRAFPKILIDYYVFIIIMLILICVSTSYNIGIDGAFKLLTLSGTVSGLGHLWFIPTILFCYLVTPIFSDIITSIDERNDTYIWADIALLLLIIHVTVMMLFRSFTPAWVNCYVIGMLYSRIIRRSRNNRKIFNMIIILLCFLIVPIQFRIDYWPHKDLPSLAVSLYGQFANYGHVFLGVTTVVFIRYIYRELENTSGLRVLLDWSDKYSYDVYLVHHIFVQSAFGCVEFISNRLVALPLAMLLTFVFAEVLYYLSSLSRKKLSTVYRIIRWRFR